jgi:hydroxyacylglutathione hydrolase
MVVDTRHAADYATAHIPGTINIPLNTSFTTWAGWLLPFDRDFYLIINEQCAHCIQEAVRDLAMIGLDRVAGYFSSTVIGEWADARHQVDSVPQITSKDLAERLRRNEAAVIDVRGRAEWAAGHLPNVPNIPLGYLTDRIDDVPRDKPVVVHCQSGSRSAIAASVLRARGLTNVMNLTGGFAAWQNAGHPIESESTEEVVGR